jgi:CRP-like cAMP-binding protein
VPVRALRSSEGEPTVPQLFEALPKDIAEPFVHGLSARGRWLPDGKAVVTAGTWFDGPWLVLEGRLRRERRVGDGMEVICEVGAGEALGLVELTSGVPWKHTLRAVGDARLVRLPVDELEDLRSSYPAFARRLQATSHHRQVEQLLQASGLFELLTPEQRSGLARRFSLHSLARGDRFLEPAAPIEGLFAVARGQVEIHVEGESLRVVGPGTVLGRWSDAAEGRLAIRGVAITEAELYFAPPETLAPALEHLELRAQLARLVRTEGLVLGLPS